MGGGGLIQDLIRGGVTLGGVVRLEEGTVLNISKTTANL